MTRFPLLALACLFGAVVATPVGAQVLPAQCAPEIGNAAGGTPQTGGKTFSFCNGCRYSFELQTRPNTPCVSYIKVGLAPVMLQGLSMVRKARAGVAGVAGQASYAYSPRPGFVGRDQFALEARYATRTGQMETVYFDFTVDVR